MEQNTKAYEQVRTLTDLLNQYRHEYYNLSAPSVSDQEYDRLFDALAGKGNRYRHEQFPDPDGGIPVCQ